MPYPKSKILAATTLLALLGGIPACVTTDDMNHVRSQVYYQDQERQKLEARLAQMESEMANTRPAQANSYAELNSMQSQVAALSGQMDDLRNSQASASGATIDSLDAKVRTMERKITFLASQMGVSMDELPGGEPTSQTPGTTGVTPPQAMMQSGASATAAPQVTAPATQAPAAPAVAAAPAAGTDAVGQDLYEKALDNFYAKRYKDAQAMWDEFVNRNPKHDLVPNALFWQGESYFQMQDYANAVLTYQQVIEKYSKSNKYRVALLKQGISFYKLKKDKAGKLVLSDLIKKFPDSAEAKRAQAYLKGGQ